MALLSRATLRTLVRQYADQEFGAGGDPLVTDTELNSYLAISYQAYHDLLTDTFEDYFATKATVTAAADSDGDYTLALPSDFLKLRDVEFLSGGVWAPMTRTSRKEASRYDANAAGLTMANGLDVRAYYIYGDKIRLVPSKSSAGSYRVWYAQRCAGFTDDTTGTVDDQQGWYEWIVLDCAIKCARKEMMDLTDLGGQLAVKTANIKAAAASRDISAPAHIIDSFFGDDDFGPGRRFP